MRGNVVVLNVWGSWCAPCRAEAHVLQSIFVRTRSAGVMFIGIDVRDNDAAARAFQHTFGITYASVTDPDGTTVVRFRDLPINAVPSTLVIDRQGRTAARFIGGVTEDDLLPSVQKMAKESPS